jgi:phosphoserine phosphatase
MTMPDTIAIIFDFDDTLAPDSTTSFLASLGIDTRRFWQEEARDLIAAGWDPIPAYLYLMLDYNRRLPPDLRITAERLAAWGRQVTLFPGATRIFSHLRQHLARVAPGVGLEFYLISSGLRQILTHTRIAQHFTDLWACDFHCHDNGEIAFPKNIISFTDKTRYLFQISKGLVGEAMRTQPFAVNRKQDGERLRIPFERMIFVGDGYTDVPCFSLIKRYGGIPIGVYDARDSRQWGKAWGFLEDGRVANLAPADYTQGSHLRSLLMMATENLANRIRLERSTYQG